MISLEEVKNVAKTYIIAYVESIIGGVNSPRGD